MLIYKDKHFEYSFDETKNNSVIEVTFKGQTIDSIFPNKSIKNLNDLKFEVKKSIIDDSL